MTSALPLLVQPHGCILIVDYELAQVIQASANAEDIIGVPAEQAIGSPLIDVIGKECHSRLLGQREESNDVLIGESVAYIAAVNGMQRELHLETRPCGDRLLLEIMPLSQHCDRRLLSAVNRWLRRLTLAQHPDILASVLLSAVQDLIDFDRVMLCAFDPQGHGAIIAENNAGRMESLEGMRFPAHGFPPYLIDQFHKVSMRWIHDIEAHPVPLRPERDSATGEQPDLSYTLLRTLPDEQIRHLRAINTRSLLSIPIHGQHNIWGLVICYAAEPRYLSPALLDAMQSIVRMATQRLHLLKARLERDFRQRVQDSRELLNAKLSLLPSTASLLSDHGQEWCELFRARGLAIAQPDGTALYGDTPGLVTLKALGHRLENHTNHHEPWFTQRAQEDPLVEGFALSDLPGLLAAPLPLGGKACGWLLIFRAEQAATHAWAGMPETARQPRKPGQLATAVELHDLWREEVAGSCEPWEDIEVSTAMDLAEDLSVVSTAQRIQALNTELQRNQEALREASKKLAFQAHHDALTGALNRYRLEGKLDEEIAAAERYDRPLSVLLFDIDHFKNFNDTYGHEAGDEVLQTVAKAVKDTLRPTDALCRWGGEEFVILAGSTDETDACRLGERLNRIVREIRLEGLPPVTVSIGMTAWRSGDNRKRFLARADEAMYEAKDAGRDQLKQR
ncbi:sensor domain-containing diguanylate cyclase [Modicisalibacter luteus]|uniref:diguanylate cyclase n=1 Tax=Modicisalibacter luteus TaxID=453962 RepID=A0ABV7LWG3_9GAMM|nr:sensor domain-containing diguanylate cyclase [Halomonas lutea]GHB14401.1 hypothetical protein GCM10007159_41020 [Halomonas lutea]